MCPSCRDSGFVGGSKCGCQEDVCVHNVEVKTQVDPVYGTEYKYKQDGHCPYCGGTVVVEDGWLICVTPGSCIYSEETE